MSLCFLAALPTRLSLASSALNRTANSSYTHLYRCTLADAISLWHPALAYTPTQSTHAAHTRNQLRRKRRHRRQRVSGNDRGPASYTALRGTPDGKRAFLPDDGRHGDDYWHGHGHTHRCLAHPPRRAGHLFVASLISAPAAIAVAKLMIPENAAPETAAGRVQLPPKDTLNGLDAAAKGASEGAHLVINVIAMLIAFIGLVALANQIIGYFDGLFNGVGAGHWSLEAGCGWVLRPLVWLMGISWIETEAVGDSWG